ncbi:hypothetical protein ACIF83_35550 [Streptomyces sp. NPDC085866]|uniref:hypothetical protein n=1 Tax=Streptomyces sp. NPDC085866 TaxID=3365736 RepID=UPI0037D1C5FC
MTVFECAECGRRLSRDVELLAQLPAHHADEVGPGEMPEATIPRGRYAIDPEPFTHGQVPGLPGDIVLHPEDAVGLLEHPDERRSEGCCGPEGLFGINRICPCGAEVGTLLADCWTACELHLHPTRVRAA